MSPSLFDPTPPTEPQRGRPIQPPAEPPTAVHPGAPSPRRRPRASRATAAMLVAAAVAGGAAGSAVVAVAGPNGTTTVDGTTTTVVRQAVANEKASAGGLDATALYAKAAPGVVDITARTTAVANQQSPFGTPGSEGGTATGTGFVIDDAGHILTAAHVIDGKSTITVTFQDGTTRTARVLGQDDATDVAVLKVDPAGLELHPLPLGSSASLQVGDPVAAIGDPFGYARSISTGVVSGVDRTIEALNGFTVAHAIQTDAALNPGNSGGPVLNAAGEVIGIADQIATGGSGANSGVGFAVPIDLVKSELAQLKAGQKVSHAYLGIGTGGVASTSTPGAVVGQVNPNGPAAQAGIQAGDTITKLGSTEIRDSNDLVAAIAAHRPGERVELTLKRGSETKTVTVTLASQPTASTVQ